MPRWAWNEAPAESKRQFFELIRRGASGQAASRAVGVSPSCGSLWFIDAGRVSFIERPISSRYLNQDDRIEIADSVAAGEAVKSIAARIGKELPNRLSGDRAQQEAGWSLPAVVRPQSGL
jgi:hypothetical protein